MGDHRDNLGSIFAKSSTSSIRGRRMSADQEGDDDEGNDSEHGQRGRHFQNRNRRDSPFSGESYDSSRSAPSLLLSSAPAMAASSAGSGAGAGASAGASAGGGASTASAPSLFGETSTTLNAIIESLPEPPGRRSNESGSDVAVAPCASVASSRMLPPLDDDLGMLTLPSTMMDALSNNDSKMASIQTKMNRMKAGHEAETRDLRRNIEELEQENANLVERIRCLTEDIDDRHAMSEYAQFIADKAPASYDSSYVLRLQSQLCKAMHKIGVLSNQLDLVKQQSGEGSLVPLRDNAVARGASTCIEQAVVAERESMNNAESTSMKKALTTLKEAHDIPELKEGSTRVSGAPLRRDNDVALTSTFPPSSSMAIDRPSSHPRSSLPYSSMPLHRANHNNDEEDDEEDDEVLKDNDDSVDSDAATATSQVTAQASNISPGDKHASRGRSPPPTTVVTKSGNSRKVRKQQQQLRGASSTNATSAVPPIHEQLVIQLQSKTSEVDELQKKFDEQAKLLAEYERSSKTQSQQHVDASAASSAASAVTRSTASAITDSASLIATKSRRELRGRGSSSSPVVQEHYHASNEAEEHQERPSSPASTSSEPDIYSTGSSSHTSSSRSHRSRSHRRSNSFPDHVSTSDIRDLVDSRGAEITTTQRQHTCGGVRNTGTRSSRKVASRKSMPHSSSSGDSPTMPLGQLPERKTSMPRTA
mmetsp:Transcript_35661/g.78141  ORF Transcript_35661/g.78141 Transcript_35661/m.78141 type:complete len:705 (-) Transcript_35661:122-2236(-)